jgi:hypothetical protein
MFDDALNNRNPKEKHRENPADPPVIVDELQLGFDVSI